MSERQHLARIRKMPRPVLLAGAAWLTALVLADAASTTYRGLQLQATGVLLQVAAALAAGLTVPLGHMIGRHRSLPGYFITAAIGTAALICGAIATFFASLTVPTAGGSGGFLAILAPVFLSILAAIAGFPAMAVLLGVGALTGLTAAKVPLAGRGTAGVLAAATVCLLWAATAIWARTPGTDGDLVAPTPASAAGTWTGPHGATFRLSPDGTFTASRLPRDIGDTSSGTTPVQGTGTWQVGALDPQPGLPSIYTTGVIFDFSNGSQAELQVEKAGNSLAMYYDLGDPDEGWTGQFRFTKQPATHGNPDG